MADPQAGLSGMQPDRLAAPVALAMSGIPALGARRYARARRIQRAISTQRGREVARVTSPM